MRKVIFALAALLSLATPAFSQVSVGVQLPGVSIGINLPVYPRLMLVPGYPIYYAPNLSLNYFFYDGMYWVYQQDNWYVSSWYNGPWSIVVPQAVPVFILQIPVRYYREPPLYFRGWAANAPPRWGEHWGPEWEQRRHGWEKAHPKSMPPPAPLPTYQQRYSEKRYPQVEQQPQLHNRNYGYQPREPMVQQQYQQFRAQPGQRPEGRGPEARGPEARGPQGRGPEHEPRGGPNNGHPPGRER